MPASKIIDRQLPILPKEIKFCKKCVVSNQRPRILFDDEGVCGACRFAKLKKNDMIDWVSREKELRELCDRYRRNDGRFDIIVPASGGKDSTRVAHELKYNYGMHPLTITWAPFEYTPEGYKNFRNFIKSGFNNLMAWQNGNFHRKLSRVAFEAIGDAWQPFTYGQVCYAFHIALAFDIKLVFFGENGEAEYSGDPRVFNLKGMPLRLWSEQYFKGATVEDIIDYGLSETSYFKSSDFDQSDLTFYRPPDIELMEKRDIQFHWFAYYKKWLPQENYYYASEHAGFQANPEGRSEGTYSKYASLDDQMDGFHYYLAFIKFGIGRTTSDAAHEVRDGHITREEAAALVKKFDGEFPKRWYREFLEYIQINDEEFWRVIDKFRQPHIWTKEYGTWKLQKTVYDDLMRPGEIPTYQNSLPKLPKA